MRNYQVIRRPILTEKAVARKDEGRALCFEVDIKATKTDIKNAVQTLFKVKVADVRTAHMLGKMKRQGRFEGYKPNWKRAYVKLKAGQKMPEFAEM
jgi:large subunit ribosomal protein L23